VCVCVCVCCDWIYVVYTCVLYMCVGIIDKHLVTDQLATLLPISIYGLTFFRADTHMHTHSTDTTHIQVVIIFKNDNTNLYTGFSMLAQIQ